MAVRFKVEVCGTLLMFMANISAQWSMDEWQGRKHGALRPHKPLRLIRDGEVGESGMLYLTPTLYAVTTRMILH